MKTSSTVGYLAGGIAGLAAIIAISNVFGGEPGTGDTCTKTCYTFDGDECDNLGWYDSCVQNPAVPCPQGQGDSGEGCSVYDQLPTPTSVCGCCVHPGPQAQAYDGCNCATNGTTTTNSKDGNCAGGDGGVDPCYCRYAASLPAPPLDPVTAETCDP